MKNITLLFVFAACLTGFSVQAQNNRNNDSRDRNDNNKSNGIAISLGAAANYYYGPGDRNLGDFNDDRLNWQVNGMLGLTIARDKNNHRTMLAGFGSFGLNSAKTVDYILADQGYVSLLPQQNSTNNVYQLEGGLLIAEAFRISTGVGQQVFDRQVLVSDNGIETSATSLKYNSTTVGFNFNVSAVAININCSFHYGQDYEKTVVVPSAGLMLRF